MDYGFFGLVKEAEGEGEKPPASVSFERRASGGKERPQPAGGAEPKGQETASGWRPRETPEPTESQPRERSQSQPASSEEQQTETEEWETPDAEQQQQQTPAGCRARKDSRTAELPLSDEECLWTMLNQAGAMLSMIADYRQRSSRRNDRFRHSDCYMRVRYLKALLRSILCSLSSMADEDGESSWDSGGRESSASSSQRSEWMECSLRLIDFLETGLPKAAVGVTAVSCIIVTIVFMFHLSFVLLFCMFILPIV
nr:uncharacterized protein LOC113824033 isoform X2 [Penaeus vannamei]